MSYCRKGFFSVNLAPVGSWRDLYRIITDWHNCKYNLQPSTPIEVTRTLSCVPEHQDVVNLLKRKRNDAYRLLLSLCLQVNKTYVTNMLFLLSIYISCIFAVDLTRKEYFPNFSPLLCIIFEYIVV